MDQKVPKYILIYFVNYKNLFNKLWCIAKRNHYSFELKITKMSSKKHWQIIKEAAGIKNNKSDLVNEIIDKDGISEKDPIKIVNLFNEHFSTIGQQTAQHILGIAGVQAVQNAFLASCVFKKIPMEYSVVFLAFWLACYFDFDTYLDYCSPSIPWMLHRNQANINLIQKGNSQS